MKNLVTYIIFGSILTACSGENNGTNSNEGESIEDEFTIITPPLSGDFQNDTVFTIDPTKATTVTAANGSSIEIPANILVDEDGKPVKKKVDISFTQYHSAADIIASGIPMQYDSAGVTNNFESAGMFTLKATSKKKKVFIKDGETVKVNLASDKADKMNFYQLDDQTGDWTYEMAPQSPIKNPRFDPSIVPLKPQERNKNAFVLDLNFDVSDYSELTAFSGIVWEYVGDHDSLDPRKNPIVGNVKWTDFSLEPTYENAFEYYLKMERGTSAYFTTKVKAALQGADLEKAMAEFEAKKAENADKMDMLQKPFIRSVQISGFNTYNYDYIHSMKEPNPVLADFKFDKHNTSKDRSLVFVYYQEQNVVVNYPPENWNLFAIDRAANCKILAVLPGNQLAVYNGKNSACYEKESYTFDMKVLDNVLNEKSDLENIIAGL